MEDLRFGTDVKKVIIESDFYSKDKPINALMVLYGYSIVYQRYLSKNEMDTSLTRAVRAYRIDTKNIAVFLPRFFWEYPDAGDSRLCFFERLGDETLEDEKIIALAISMLKKKKEKGIFQLKLRFFEYDPVNDDILFDEDEGKKIIDGDPVEKAKDSHKAIKNNTNKNELTSVNKKIQSLKYSLKDKILGQDAAIKQVLDGLFDVFFAAPTFERNSPLGVFFFAGPPGVGKTMTASLIAKCLGRKSLHLDMTQYAAESDFFQLTGTDKSYKDSHEGIITKAVKSDPNIVLIFDEIEKCSYRAQNIFLQILSSGEYRDDCSHALVNCRDTIMIFTSNAGKSLYEGKENFSTIPKSVLKDALIKERRITSNNEDVSIISEALLSRFMSNTVVMFDNIDVYNLEELSRRNMTEICNKYKESIGMEINVDDYQPLLFLYNSGDSLDARIASGKSADFIKQGIQEAARQIGNRSDLFDGAKSIDFKVDIPENNEIRRLFVSEEKIKILVVCDKTLFKEISSDNKEYELIPGECDVEKLPKDVQLDAIVIDPFVDMNEDHSEYIGLEDRDIPGVNFIKDLVEDRVNFPIYLLSTKHNKISKTDEETFVNNGVKGVIRLEEDNIIECLDVIAKKRYMIEQYKRLSRKGQIIDYDLSIEREDRSDSVVVRYYNLRKKQAIDSATGQTALSDEERPKTSFDDVIGAEHAKEELRYFVDYMKEPSKHIRKGDAPARGILLYGPPGTGKTMLARAVAGESECTFFQMNAAEFIEGTVGNGEKKVRDLFAKARKYAPSIIFIDEIDSIGKSRFDSADKNHTHSILTTLLTEMDGFDSHGGDPVFVLAATNYSVRGENALSLDPGLERRFNNRIYVDLPKKEDRKKFLELVCRKKNYTGITPECIRNMADRTVGRSLAELEQVIELMHRKAVRAGEKESDRLLTDTLDEYLYGKEKKHDDDSYEKTAIHEAGHAYISWKCGVTPSFVTIVSRGGFGGYMRFGDDEDKAYYSVKELRDKIKICLAGRISEQEFYDEESINTGASSDLEQASKIAMDIVIKYGMDGDNYALCEQNWITSPASVTYIERAKEIIREETEKCKVMVHEGKKTIKRISESLLENSSLTEKQLEEILQKWF